MPKNSDMQKAQRDKKDEFYTQLSDIEAEMKYYKAHFKGKTVFCNCDDPYESNFFKYFAMNFNYLGLKKLIATCYASSPIMYTQLTLWGEEELVNKCEYGGKPYKVEITSVEDANGDGAIDLEDIEILLKRNKPQLLKGDGDFRSDECIELLKEADIVVTNPPFSLFRQYVSVLEKYKKSYLIIGNVNAINYKEIIPLVMDNKIWLGASIHSGDREFRVPDNYPLEAAGCRIDNIGNKYIRVKGVRWWTNLDYQQRHEDLILYCKYSPERYPKYDNYNAIDVNVTKEIPCDYYDVMGVPLTFIDFYNPEQFEILGITSGRDEFDPLAYPSKRYINPVQHNPDGSIANGSKVNTGAEISYKDKPDGVYYTADNAEGYLKRTYSRLLIRRRHNGN